MAKATLDEVFAKSAAVLNTDLKKLRFLVKHGLFHNTNIAANAFALMDRFSYASSLTLFYQRTHALP